MKGLKPGIMEKAVFVFAMVYLCVCHIYRLVYDYGGYTLDITGPLMINTQRLTSLAFSLRDGSVKDEAKLSPTMKKQALKRFPSFLEFWSYIFCFHGMMCGPFCFYKDYKDFIEGENYSIRGDTQNDKSHNDVKRTPPSPTRAVIQKLITAAVSGILMMVVLPRFPIEFFNADEFLYEYSFFMKMYYVVMSTSLTRTKYYLAWKLGEAINANCGLGYNGVDKDGNEQWDLIDNADIYKVEFSTSLKVLLDNWNKMTTQWLRYTVYERVHSTMAVFVLSAFWHGFYAGYYLTFVAGAFFIQAGRLIRRNIRPYFQSSDVAARFYHLVTFIMTRFAIAYTVFPHMLLQFGWAWKVYRSMYFWYHILVIIAIVGLTAFPLKPRDRDAKKTQ